MSFTIKESSQQFPAEVLLINELAKCCRFKAGERIILSKKQRKLLKQGMPVQKIIGHTHFGKLKIPLHRAVFIPRLETYELFLRALSLIKEYLQASITAPLKILDLCCGTGILGLSLKQILQTKAEVYLVDISGEAIETAQQVASENKLDVKFFKGDLFEALPPRKFDLIIANPPYLSEAEIGEVEYEPRLALFGGKDGLDIYKRILAKISLWTSRNSLIIFEISPTVAAFFRSLAFEVEADINKKERFAWKINV